MDQIIPASAIASDTPRTERHPTSDANQAISRISGHMDCDIVCLPSVIGQQSPLRAAAAIRVNDQSRSGASLMAPSFGDRIGAKGISSPSEGRTASGTRVGDYVRSARASSPPLSRNSGVSHREPGCCRINDLACREIQVRVVAAVTRRQSTSTMGSEGRPRYMLDWALRACLCSRCDGYLLGGLGYALAAQAGTLK